MKIKNLLKSKYFWQTFTKSSLIGVSFLVLVFVTLPGTTDLFSQKIKNVSADDWASDYHDWYTGNLDSGWGATDAVNQYNYDNGTSYDINNFPAEGQLSGGESFGMPVNDSVAPAETLPAAPASDSTVLEFGQLTDGQPFSTTDVTSFGPLTDGAPFPTYSLPTPTCSYNCYPPALTTVIYPNPAPIVYPNPAPIVYPQPISYPTPAPVQPGNYYNYSPTNYTYTSTATDNSRYSSSSSTKIDSHNKTDSHAYQYADIGSFNDSHANQFAQSGFNTSDSHDVSLSQGGGGAAGYGYPATTSVQSVAYSQPAIGSSPYRAIDYYHSGVGSTTTSEGYRQIPVVNSYSTPRTTYAISQATTTAAGNTVVVPAGTNYCPSGTTPATDDQGNTTCVQSTSKTEVLQPKVMSLSTDNATELPKTGLPAAGLILSGLLPVGLKLRKLNKLSSAKTANSIWEDRQLLK